MHALLGYFLVHLNVGEEFSNLVSILARSRHFNGTSPIKVVVAKQVGEVLNGGFLELGVIEADIEVSREHTALVCKLRN